MFTLAAKNWLESKTPHLAPRSVAVEKANLKHLKPSFGRLLLCDITAEKIASYQAKRLRQGASPKTINLEVATVRAILRKNRMWAAIQPDVRMLRTEDKAGRAISAEEEAALLEACQQSRSRSLYPAVVLALNTCMRYGELRLLKWAQVDFGARTVTVGKSKTDAGTGRVIPLNDRAYTVLKFWAELFPVREPSHYIFPQEKYGLAQCENRLKGSTHACFHSTDPKKPIGRWKEAWEAARKRADAILKEKNRKGGVPEPEPLRCRFHDLRHTGCTRMLEGGVPFPVVADIMGWSASTAIRMAKRYGHIGDKARKEAVDKLVATIAPGSLQKSLQSDGASAGQRAN